ncbi:MAG: O-antigen ligase family protein [Peptococcaceae bacterium]|jgi:O-antigen ligase|nr:O-antigen ligase family protein [Peptococcaceae bacterium]
MIWNIGITRQNQAKLLLLLTVLLSAILLPSFLIHESLPRLRVDEVLIFGACAVNIVVMITRGFRFDKYGWGASDEQKQAATAQVTRVFLLLIAVYVISNLYGGLFMHTAFGVRDVMELVTFAKYYLVITLVIALDLGRPEQMILRRVFLVGFFLSMFLSWGQYLNLAYMNSWLTPLLAPAHLDNLVNANPPRVVGTFDNPNVMGVFAVMTLALIVPRFYFQRQSTQVAALLWLLCGLTVKLAFLTISRTALLSCAAVLVFYSVWALLKFHLNRQILLRVVLLFVLTMTVFLTSPREFTTRMGEATNIQKSTSAIGHLMQWDEAMIVIQQSPILGWGTGKTQMTTLVDDEYILITRRYGIAGLLAYVWFFVKPVTLAARRIRGNYTFSSESGYTEPGVLLAIGLIGATLAAAVYNLTAGLFYNLQIMTLFSILLGLIYHPER